MFTGIIEELGTVTRVERSADAARLTVRGPLAVLHALHGEGSAHGEARRVERGADARDGAELLDDSGEHVSSLRSVWGGR